MTNATDGRLEVRHTYTHPPERVFDAWTDEVGMRQWMRPGPIDGVRTALDVRVGGSYTIEMISPGGSIVHTGEYTVVDRPRRLAFTWMAAHFERPTRVTIDFEAVDGGTVVTLVHEGLPSEESVTNHTAGWAAILEALEGALA